MFKQKKMFLIIAGLVLLAAAYFNQNNSVENGLAGNNNNLNSLDSISAQESRVEKTSIIVHLSGAVKNAGVYELSDQKRLVDLVKAAGGLKQNAAVEQINLAEEIYDGQKIIIPEIITNDLDDFGSGNNIGSDLENTNNKLYNYSSSNTDNSINLNQASQSELENLNGIGPSKASAIIKYRDKNGDFSQKEDLLKVSGIGEKTLANIEDEIRLR